jgi:hypothetical protein
LLAFVVRRVGLSEQPGSHPHFTVDLGLLFQPLRIHALALIRRLLAATGLTLALIGGPLPLIRRPLALSAVRSRSSASRSRTSAAHSRRWAARSFIAFAPHGPAQQPADRS